MPECREMTGIMTYNSHVRKIQMKDDEIQELKEKEKRLAGELQKSGKELERKDREVVVKIAKKIREVDALERNQQELEDKNTELTTQIEQNNHELEELTRKRQELEDRNTKLTTQIEQNNRELKGLRRNKKELAQLTRNVMKYEIMCVKNIMGDLDQAGEDARTKRKLVQHLQERIIAFELYLYIQYIAGSHDDEQYERLKLDYNEKLHEVLSKEDYDLFLTQYRAVADASLNTLSVSVDSEEYKLLENKYDTVLNEAMEQICKV